MGMGKSVGGRELTYRVMFLACSAQVGGGGSRKPACMSTPCT